MEYASDTEPPTIGIKLDAANLTVLLATESAAAPAMPFIDITAVNIVISAVSSHFTALFIELITPSSCKAPFTELTILRANTIPEKGRRIFEAA